MMMMMAGCDNRSDIDVQERPPQSYTISGSAVKAPWVHAQVQLYELDLSNPDFLGRLVTTGKTDRQAKFEGVTIPDLTRHYMLVVNTTEETVELGNNAMPMIDTMYSFLPANAFIENAQDINLIATPLTTMAVKLAIQNADLNSGLYEGNGDGITTESEWLAALDTATDVVKSLMGYSLVDDIDIYTQTPVVAHTSSEENKSDAFHYRLAIEATGALIQHLATNNDTNILFNDVLSDMADGKIEGAQHYQLEDVIRFSQALMTQPIVNGGEKTLSDLGEYLQVEAKSININDDFSPQQPTQMLSQYYVVDVDNDGFFNNRDEDDDNDGLNDTQERLTDRDTTLQPLQIFEKYAKQEVGARAPTLNDYNDIDIDVSDELIEELNAFVFNQLNKIDNDFTDRQKIEAYKTLKSTPAGTEQYQQAQHILAHHAPLEQTDSDNESIADNQERDDNSDTTPDTTDNNNVTDIDTTPDTADNNDDTTTEDSIDSRFAIVGSAVKGPMVNANVSIYRLDLSQPDLRGELVSSGTTDAQAMYQGITLPNREHAHLLVVSTAPTTRELTSTARPHVNELISYIPAIMGTETETSTSIMATPLTTMVVKLAQRNADSTRKAFIGDQDGIISESEWATAITAATGLVKSLMGYSLIDDVDIFKQTPIVTNENDEGKKGKAFKHRLAIEAAGALLLELSTTSEIDTTLDALVTDMADGQINDNSSYSVDDIHLFNMDILDKPLPNGNGLKLKQALTHLQQEELQLNPSQATDFNQLIPPILLSQSFDVDTDQDEIINSLDDDDDNDGKSDQEERNTGRDSARHPHTIFDDYAKQRVGARVPKLVDYEDLSIDVSTDPQQKEILNQFVIDAEAESLPIKAHERVMAFHKIRDTNKARSERIQALQDLNLLVSDDLEQQDLIEALDNNTTVTLSELKGLVGKNNRIHKSLRDQRRDNQLTPEDFLPHGIHFDSADEIDMVFEQPFITPSLKVEHIRERKQTIATLLKYYRQEPNAAEPDGPTYRGAGLHQIEDEDVDYLNQVIQSNTLLSEKKILKLIRLFSHRYPVDEALLLEQGIGDQTSIATLGVMRIQNVIQGHKLVRKEQINAYISATTTVGNVGEAGRIHTFHIDNEKANFNGFPTQLAKANGDIFGVTRIQRNNYLVTSPVNSDMYAMGSNMRGALLLKKDASPYFTPIYTPAGFSSAAAAFSNFDENHIVAIFSNRDLIVDETTLSVRHPFGVYTSHDKGETWDLTHQYAGLSQEPMGNQSIIWGNTQALKDWVFLATHRDGLYISKDAGLSFQPVANYYASTLNTTFESNTFIRSLALTHDSSTGEQYLFVIAKPSAYYTTSGVDSSSTPDGEGYRLTISGGEITEVQLLNNYFNQNNVERKYADIVFEVGGKEGYGLFYDKKDVNLEGSGGRHVARIGDYGDIICDLQTSDPYCNDYNATPGVTAQNQEICSIANNPYNPNMWVMLRGGETRTSAVVSTDDGLTWQYENRATIEHNGEDYVTSMTMSSAIYEDPQYAAIQNGNYQYLLNTTTGCQGVSIGFIDAVSFRMIPISKEKPILVTRDSGATFSTEEISSENKWVMEASIDGDYQLIAFGEYGFKYSIDGGKSYRVINDLTRQTIKDLKAKAAPIVDSHASQARGQAAVIKSTSTGFSAYILYTEVAYLVRLDYDKEADTLSITPIMQNGDNLSPSYTLNYENFVNFNAAGRSFWRQNYIYIGNLVSRDNGLTFNHMCMNDDCSARENWYIVMDVHPSDPQKIVAYHEKQTAKDIKLSVSYDAGVTWNLLPNTELYETAHGKTYAIRSITYYGDVKKGVSFIPEVGNQLNDQSFALFVAGRSGLYRFDYDSQSPTPFNQLPWTLLDKFLPIEASRENKPWLSEILFNPAQPNIAVAVQINDKSIFGNWFSFTAVSKQEFYYKPNTTEHPIYISFDSGKRWYNLRNDKLSPYTAFASVTFSAEGDLMLYTANYGVITIPLASMDWLSVQ
ncbi:hypothetical protein [Photobacterium leiognathi]|uniref:hypothetical protein n=1 Tax=Photobacterium leiognathi TaxID=553611 RepID=UPI002739B2D0|nr:hypothetical protein [Photobacterium leiognathi]